MCKSKHKAAATRHVPLKTSTAHYWDIITKSASASGPSTKLMMSAWQVWKTWSTWRCRKQWQRNVPCRQEAMLPVRLRMLVVNPKPHIWTFEQTSEQPNIRLMLILLMLLSNSSADICIDAQAHIKCTCNHTKNACDLVLLSNNYDGLTLRGMHYSRWLHVCWTPLHCCETPIWLYALVLRHRVAHINIC